MATRVVRRVVAAVVVALAITGSAAAGDEQRGIDPNQGESLVEVYLDSKAAAIELQLAADDYGIGFNEHYLRREGNGGVTVTVFGSEEELQALEAAGYSVGSVIEGPATWRERAADWQADVKAEKRAEQAATQEGAVEPADTGEIVVLRADLFENYAGRFLSVEAKTRLATVLPQGGVYTGPTLVLAWNRGGATPVDSDPRTMNVNIDVDTTPDTYIEHRILVRIGDAGTTTPASPTMIRIGSSTGEAKNAPVEPWLDGGLPPMASTFQTGFHTRYMDPTEVYARFDELAEEFPNLAEMITLPNKTNGYQRRAQALMAGLTNPAGVGNLNATAATQAVILTVARVGPRGRKRPHGRVPQPERAQLAAHRLVHGRQGPRREPGHRAHGSARRARLRRSPRRSTRARAVAKLVAQTYRGNAGGGIVQARPSGNLSDFLTTSTNAHVQRGPFEYAVMRIRTKAREQRARSACSSTASSTRASGRRR